MNKFNIGDRIRVYYINPVSLLPCSEITKVLFIHEGLVLTTRRKTYHTIQCRKLINKPKLKKIKG